MELTHPKGTDRGRQEDRRETGRRHHKERENAETPETPNNWNSPRQEDGNAREPITTDQ